MPRQPSSRGGRARRTEKRDALVAGAKPINDAIAKLKTVLMQALAEGNHAIHACSSKCALQVRVERLHGEYEDRLVIAGNLGDRHGPFTLATVTADVEGRLTARFRFCESRPQVVTADHLCQMVREFGQSPDLV